MATGTSSVHKADLTVDRGPFTAGSHRLAQEGAMTARIALIVAPVPVVASVACSRDVEDVGWALFLSRGGAS